MRPVRVTLRSVPYPTRRTPKQSIYFPSKPPLYPFYDRTHALNLITREYYTHHLQKRRNQSKHKIPTPLPMDCQIPPPSTPYAKLLTPHAVTARPTRLEKIFEKTSNPQKRHPPPKQPANFLDGLMLKARVGPNTLIQREPSPRAGNSVMGGARQRKKQADKRVERGPRGNAPRTNRATRDVRRGKMSTKNRNGESETANIKPSARARSPSPAPRHRPASRPTSRSRSPPIPRRGDKRRTRPGGKSVETAMRPAKKLRGDCFAGRSYSDDELSTVASLRRRDVRHDSSAETNTNTSNSRPEQHRVHSVGNTPTSSVNNLSSVNPLRRQHARPTVSSTENPVSRPVKKHRVDGVAKKQIPSVKNVTKVTNNVSKVTPLGKHATQATAQNAVALPLKKRCSGNNTHLDSRVKPGTDVTVGRKQIDAVDLSRLETTTASRRITPVMESPVSVTQSPFTVAELKLSKPAKIAPAPNRHRRGLSFERRPRKLSQPLLYIADPREEDKLRSAFEAVQVKTLEKRSAEERGSQHSRSHDWEITFV